MSGVRRLVVGASGSPGSLRALRYARGLARQHPVPLVAVLAWVPPGGDLAERRYPSAALRKVWREEAEKRLQTALREAWGGVPLDLEVRPAVVRGDARLVLVQMASSQDDLLVIGAGRRGWAARMWHGRVGRYCLAHARCPVLAVPQPTARDLGLGGARWVLRRRELTLEQALRDWEDRRIATAGDGSPGPGETG